MPWRPVLLPRERTAHLSSTLRGSGVDIEDFVVESSVGWRNGSWQASPPVQYRQRDVGGISGGEGVDGPGGGGRSSFEVSVPQQRGDEQNERWP